MAPKNRDFKTTYTTEKILEEFFTGHHIDIDPTGRLMITPCLNSIQFIDIQSAKQVHEIKLTDANDEESGEYIITFAFKGNRLVVACNSGLLRHYSIEIHEQQEPISKIAVESVLLRTWKSLHIGPIAAIRFDTTDTLVATGGSGDSSVKIWDIVNNYCTHNFKEAKGVVNTLAFAPTFIPEAYYLFGSGDDAVIHVWNLITSKHVIALQGHCGKITDIAFSQDGLKMISSSRDKLIIVWNCATFEKERTTAVFESIETVCIIPREFLNVIKKKVQTPDSVLVTAGENGLLKVWDYDSGNLLYTQTKSLIRVGEKREDNQEQDGDDQQAHSQYNLINQLIFNPNLGQVIAASFDKDIIFHDVADLLPLRQLVGQNDEILDIKLVGEKETHIAAAANSPKIKVFELATSNCFILLGHTDIVLALAVFPQNPFLMVSSSKDNSVRVWQFSEDCASAVCLYHGTGHTHSVTSISTSLLDAKPDASLFFLSGSEDTTLKFWKVPDDLSSFEENQSNQSLPSMIVSKLTQSCHEKAINSIDVSPNNQLIATGSQDKTAKLWLLPQLKLVGIFRGHKKGIWHVKFSPVDQVLATCSADSTIKIWSIDDHSCLKTFQGHTSSVLNLVFIDHGMQFISSASDGNLKIWNLKSNECISTFDAHEGKVWALAISNDEETIVTGSDDSRIVVWKNITSEVKEKEAIKTEQSIQSEQTLQNLLHKKSWLKALKMAIRMEHPFRSLNILKEILLETGNIEGTIEQLSRLRQDQLLTLLEFAVHWNTNSKHFVVAHCVIRAVMEQIPPHELLQMADFKVKLEKLLPYCERHMTRVKRLQQYVTFADFVYEKMKLPDAEE